MSTDSFTYDVFLSHSAKDKAVVRPLAERLRQDGPHRNPQRSTFNPQPFERLDDAPIRGSPASLLPFSSLTSSVSRVRIQT